VLYLSGASNVALKAVSFSHNIGFMYTPNMGYKPLEVGCYPFWAADTGCYSASSTFRLMAYLKWLEGLPRDTCLFATAPDVVGDAVTTWGRSMDILPVLREMGYKAALVAQDGIEHMSVDWAAFDVLFVGGSTVFKLSEAAYELVREAKTHGKWCHMGRVNSRRRFMAAAVSGYDSADGTYLKYGPDVLLPKLQGWVSDPQMRFTA
jgi:hypothetical protein